MKYDFNGFYMFFSILYKVETWPRWKIYSTPCNATLNKFYCINIIHVDERVREQVGPLHHCSNDVIIAHRGNQSITTKHVPYHFIMGSCGTELDFTARSRQLTV
jgi:hypothetical protein